MLLRKMSQRGGPGEGQQGQQNWSHNNNYSGTSSSQAPRPLSPRRGPGGAGAPPPAMVAV